VAGRVSAQARPRGRHALRSRAFVDELVRDAGVAPGSLVLDLGAGGGIITGALVAAGARVRAVELDGAALRQLRSRFAGEPGVEVVAADATRVRLPDEPFAVVANLPFASGTAILRLLLGDPRVPLMQLDAIVEWGLAAKRTAVWPSTLLGCTWGARYELRLVRRVPRGCFAPPPSVDAALLRATRRAEPLVPPRRAAAYEALLRRAFGAQRPLDRILPRGAVHRAAHELGFDRHATARDLDPRQWAGLYCAIGSPR
jgi:23S rRNA (adenine-N6)-dimethyltransferase